jgi:hypothetical protein
VPYVFFASPSEKHACPKSAACWSPSTPAMRTPGSTESAAHAPTTPDEGTTRGSMAAGTRKARSAAGAHASVRTSSSSVREALLASVTCSGAGAPAAREEVRRQIRKESIGPASATPASASARRPGTLSSAHASLEAVK